MASKVLQVLNYADVVDVKIDAGVLSGELIREHDDEAAGAVDGVELRGGVLVLVGQPPRRGELRLLEEPQAEISVAMVVVGTVIGVGGAHCLNLKP
ncbi:ran-binding protein 10-like [Pyrus ussuriensis x Pyrus communis]|uniref:Ran-binding protein 10-like n=1 Tax=Pyrus ussuriensis x Pyrus communis TaxID=2448454 RepID=A0A5N5F901_9ROSA|nr:ran-binding protein 10-like [Pyrus ussuriensis x Pyrus communis]